MPLLDQLDCYKPLQDLSKLSVQLSSLLTDTRLRDCAIRSSQLQYHYATSLLTDAHLSLFDTLIDQQAVFKHIDHMLAGDLVNLSEQRAVSHHQLRHPSATSAYASEKQALHDFVRSIHDEKHYTDVVQIGIGGSHLGPETICSALSFAGLSSYLRPHFVANLDPSDLSTCLSSLSLEKTLFIIVSKSGSTLETHCNLEKLLSMAQSQGLSRDVFSKQLISVSCPGSLLDDDTLFGHRFHLDPSIGGRFSVSSMVGGVLLALVYGTDVFNDFLMGAHAMDQHAFNEKNIKQNMVLLDACNSVWQRVFLNFSSEAVLVYSHALSLFPDHLQQLFCESLGKTVSADGEPISYPTSPLLFGGVGSLYQHSFGQMLHQGSDIIPAQFIGVKDQDPLLNQNLMAQMVGLALGDSGSSAYDRLPGNRPSTLLLLDRLSPFELGQLVSFYENKVGFMALLLGLNAYDQPGVEYAKRLAASFGKKDMPPLLSAFSSFILSPK